ncbi:Uncharacterised protein [Leclercia adecarboxylata]|uniref:NodB homology domain-containing protein n=1 Tax=Leclercia adecarboxylata TaxID=83655 RepID=A0A4U9HP33_9ENTR|nr:Uncharacterised protein [Leclercia adecarboxylata]
MYQLEGYVRNKMNLPARAVVITFDDGLKSVSRYAWADPEAVRFSRHGVYYLLADQSPSAEVGPPIATVYEHFRAARDPGCV